MPRLVLLLGLAACASAPPVDDPPAADPPGDSGAAWWAADPGDPDGDGADDDCDEARADVGATAPDACNGRDDDCDGAIDEDAGDPEGDEPTALGRLPDEGEVLLYPSLFPAGDTDRWRFRVNDGLLSLFDIEVYLYQPAWAGDYALELRWVEDPSGRDRGVVASADDTGPGGVEHLEWAGVGGQDDSGLYELTVTVAEGASCQAPVVIQLLVGGW